MLSLQLYFLLLSPPQLYNTLSSPQSPLIPSCPQPLPSPAHLLSPNVIPNARSRPILRMCLTSVTDTLPTRSPPRCYLLLHLLHTVFFSSSLSLTFFASFFLYLSYYFIASFPPPSLIISRLSSSSYILTLPTCPTFPFLHPKARSLPFPFPFSSLHVLSSRALFSLHSFLYYPQTYRPSLPSPHSFPSSLTQSVIFLPHSPSSSPPSSPVSPPASTPLSSTFSPRPPHSRCLKISGKTRIAFEFCSSDRTPSPFLLPLAAHLGEMDNRLQSSGMGERGEHAKDKRREKGREGRMKTKEGKRRGSEKR